MGRATDQEDREIIQLQWKKGSWYAGSNQVNVESIGPPLLLEYVLQGSSDLPPLELIAKGASHKPQLKSEKRIGYTVSKDSKYLTSADTQMQIGRHMSAQELDDCPIVRSVQLYKIN